MKILVFLFALTLQAQTVITIIPFTDNTGTPTATGELRFMDEGAHYVGFKSPTSLPSNLIFTLPPADAAGCWVSNGSLVLTVDPTCTGTSITGTAPITYGSGTIACPTCLTTGGGQTITGVKTFDANIAVGTDSTYSIGATALRPLNIFAGNIIETPDIRLDYRFGTTVGDYFDLYAGPSSAGVMGIKDSSSNQILGYDSAGPFWIFRSSLAPNADNTYDVGTSGLRWKNGYFAGTLNVGSCVGCSSPADMMTTDTNQTVTGIKTFSNNILFTSDNVDSIGATGTRPGNIFAANIIESPDIRIDYRVGTTVSSYFDIMALFNILEIRDSSFNPILAYQNFGGSSEQWLFTGNVMPQSNNTYSLGTNTNQYSGLFVAGASMLNGGLTTGLGSNSNLFIGTGGNFYTRFLSTGAGGSAGVSCTGKADGWNAVTQDGYIVYCGSGVRSRAALTIY